MPDPETNRGSLPAFAIVIAVVLGILVLLLVVFLFINRNKEGSYTKLLHRRKPTADSMRKTVYPFDESNPGRPLHAPPRVQPASYNPPRLYPLGGPPRSGRIRPEESERLLPNHVNQAFVPRELELKPQTPYLNAGFNRPPASPRGMRPNAPRPFGPSLYPTSIGVAGGYIR